QIAQITHVLTRADLQLMAGQQVSHGILKDHRMAPLQQEALQTTQGIHDTATAQATNQSDTAEMLHRSLANNQLRKIPHRHERTDEAVIIRSEGALGK